MVITKQKEKIIFLNNNNSVCISELGELKTNELVYTLLKYNDYLIIEMARDGEVVNKITIHIKNKRVIDYEGVYFLNKNITKLLRNNGFIVPKECLI